MQVTAHIRSAAVRHERPPAAILAIGATDRSRTAALGSAAVTVVFLHIPKTAGTSVRSMLRGQYERIYEVPAGQRSRDLALLAVRSRRRRPDLVMGHVRYGIHRLIPAEVEYLTFLRNPVDRVISEYLYLRDRHPDPQHRAEAARTTLLGHADTERDRQVRMLAGHRQGPRQMTEADLDLARAHLEGMQVGIAEDVDASMRRLATHFGWSAMPAERLNVNPSPASIPDAEREELARLNSLDMSLWTEARTRNSPPPDEGGGLSGG